MEIEDGDLFDLPMIVEEAKVFNELAKDGYGKFLTYDPQSVLKGITSVVMRGGKYWVLWDENEFAGICMGGIVPNFYNHAQMVATCGFIAVMPKYQRTQWGTKLMKKFEDWAKDEGADFVCYEGYDKKWIRTMKRKGFMRTGVKFMKEI